VTDQRQELVRIVEKGLLRLPEPVRLASGELSREFIDGKRALAHGADLRLACQQLIDAVGGIEFDAVGGLTMGADQFAHVVAVLAECHWFVVRKQPKDRGTRKLIEGADVTGARVLLVDDVITTGGSIATALTAVEEAGAAVVAAATLVDRGDRAARLFAERNVPYFPLLTYRDLGIPPVGAQLAPA
jgi:orotate phosphoribosyltransferase